MMYFRLAWRNMWRSRRRTLITISSIFFAVALAILMRVMLVGIFDKMITDTVSISTGYLQIHQKGYWDNKSIDSSFDERDLPDSLLDRQKEISAWAPHLESFVLASSGERTKGILITGIAPQKEDRLSALSRKIISGSYISDKNEGILLSEGLADYLKLKTGDTVILLGQGYHGEIAAGKYPIRGIARLGVPEMNKGMAWLSLSKARELLSVGSRYTSVSIMLHDRNKLEYVRKELSREIGKGGYEVMTWKEMLPELDQLFEAKMAQNLIMSGILYLVIAFGIFGALVMMLAERMHEFGILIAIGMKKAILSWIVALEMAILSIVGAMLGIAVTYPLALYYRSRPIRMGGAWGEEARQFNFEPVIQPSTDFSHFIMQGYIVLFISLVISLYAVLRIQKIHVITAING